MLAVHLAALLAETGRVLLMDCDDQCNAFLFYLRRRPAREMELATVPTEVVRRLSVLWNPNRSSVRRSLLDFDYVVIDIDTVMANTVTTIVQSKPDLILIPVNGQDLTLRHLPAVLELLAKLEETIGPSVRTVVVPLGRSNEETASWLERSPINPSDCRVAPAARSLPKETSSALANGTLIWTVDGCGDQLAYFQSLAII